MLNKFSFLRTSSPTEIIKKHDPFTEEGLKIWSKSKLSSILSSHSLFEKDYDWKQIQLIQKNLFNLKLHPEFDKSMGSFLGMAIGDALGAPFEFTDYIPNPHPQQNALYMRDGLCQSNLWLEAKNTFDLKVGQWTDDASMGFCLADSLICCSGFNAVDLRRRFHLWWYYGYANAFGKDENRGDKASVGLGGNISLSLREFKDYMGKGLPPPEETQMGDLDTSGNGSIMRNAAIPIFFKNNLENALLFAAKQSKTTHRGIEAYECCRLLTYIIIKALKNPGYSAKEILENLQDFKADPHTIQLSKNPLNIIHLANSTKNNNSDMNWDWKNISFKYSPTRARQQPGYIGSYAMDAMAMSLHCIYHTHCFADALMKCANYRGDSDSVCAVAGQIAGAIYGWKNIPIQWVEKIQQWDKDDEILLRGYKLFLGHSKVYWPENRYDNTTNERKPEDSIDSISNIVIIDSN